MDGSRLINAALAWRAERHGTQNADDLIIHLVMIERGMAEHEAVEWCADHIEEIRANMD